MGTYNNVTRTIDSGKNKYVLVDSVNKMFIENSSALKNTTLSLYSQNVELKDQDGIDKTCSIYHKAYFDSSYVMAMFNWSGLGSEGEYSYYKVYDAFFKHYFPEKLGFSVQSQVKDHGNIWDFSIMVLDPRTYQLTRDIMGIDKVGANINEDLFHQVHTLIEGKKPKAGHGEQWNSILKQLQKYHTSSDKNTNSFSIAIDGTKIAFFIYIQDAHSCYINKGHDFNGFLCLRATNEGVTLVEQKDIFAPQITWYDMIGSDSDISGAKYDKHSTAPVSKHLKSHQIVGIQDSKILQMMKHDGKLEALIYHGCISTTF